MECQSMDFIIALLTVWLYTHNYCYCYLDNLNICFDSCLQSLTCIGWNEIPIDNSADDPSNWDSIVISLPAGIHIFKTVDTL